MGRIVCYSGKEGKMYLRVDWIIPKHLLKEESSSTQQFSFTYLQMYMYVQCFLGITHVLSLGMNYLFYQPICPSYTCTCTCIVLLYSSNSLMEIYHPRRLDKPKDEVSHLTTNKYYNMIS